MKGNYTVWNGEEWVSQLSPLFPIGNRGFRYGDGAFETIRVVSGRMVFFSEHIARLRNGVNILELNCPELDDVFTLNELGLSVLKQNEINKGGRLRIWVVRAGEGMDHSIEKSVLFFMGAEAYPHNLYPEVSPRKAIVYPNPLLLSSPLTQFKSCNRIAYQMAARYARTRGIDEGLLLNQFGNIGDAVGANLIYSIDGNWFTPGSSEGAIPGVLKQWVQNSIPGLITDRPFRIEDISKVNYIFTANVMAGPVSLVSVQMGDKTFHFPESPMVAKIRKELNKKVKA